jgi:hypothetical protein
MPVQGSEFKVPGLSSNLELEPETVQFPFIVSPFPRRPGLYSNHALMAAACCFQNPDMSPT